MNSHYHDQIIIDKIKKLIALSGSPNEKEAASALSKARTLLAKYGIEYSKIKDVHENVIEKELLKDNKIQDWQFKLIECITASTFTEAIIETDDEENTIIIIGRKVNVTAAFNFYSYLNETIIRVSKKYEILVRDLESFRYGMVEKIQERLKVSEQKESASDKNELVPIINKETAVENMNFIKNTYGDIGNRDGKKSVEENSYGLGKIIGGKISLEKQITKDGT